MCIIFATYLLHSRVQIISNDVHKINEDSKNICFYFCKFYNLSEFPKNSVVNLKNKGFFRMMSRYGVLLHSSSSQCILLKFDMDIAKCVNFKIVLNEKFGVSSLKPRNWTLKYVLYSSSKFLKFKNKIYGFCQCTIINFTWILIANCANFEIFINKFLCGLFRAMKF